MIKYFLLFLILASPLVFRMVRKVLGTWVSSAEGLPSSAGLALHAFIFAFLCSRVVSMYGLGFRGFGRPLVKKSASPLPPPPPPPPPPEQDQDQTPDDPGTSTFYQNIFGSYI
jgi:hypothetical protein